MLLTGIGLLAIDLLSMKVKPFRNSKLIREYSLPLGFTLYLVYYAIFLAAFLRSDFTLESGIELLLLESFPLYQSYSQAGRGPVEAYSYSQQ